MGTKILVDDQRMPIELAKKAKKEMVRFRTLGCYPLTGAVASNANSLLKIIKEMLLSTTSERQGRLIDSDADASMEKKTRRLFLMGRQEKIITQNIESILKLHEDKEMLRFITCGSVDDGKSTLIGRLLFDSKALFKDQLSEVEKDTKRHGTTGTNIDFALLVDGLSSEREQGITIDVAYRFFATKMRKFIIADTPGHEQYTRNMVTGASTADLSIILVDARQGVLEQTKRHSYIAALLGIKYFIVAINKMDLVDFSKEVFDNIKKDYEDNVIPNLPYHSNISFFFIPISALDGDNVVTDSKRCNWYKGKSLINLLNTITIIKSENKSFRFPIQYVSRPHLNFRGYSGTIMSGNVKVGDEVMVLPSKQKSTVKSIVSTEIKDLRSIGKDEKIETVNEAFSPMAITITLIDQIDISRGNMLVKCESVPNSSNQFSANVVWMDENSMLLNNNYFFKFASNKINGVFDSVNYVKEINTFKHKNSNFLKLNDIGKCTLTLEKPIAFDSYYKNYSTGNFIVIDRITKKTIAAGMLLTSIINFR